MIIGITVPDSGNHQSLRSTVFNRSLLKRGRLSARRARPLQEDEGDGSTHLPRPAPRPSTQLLPRSVRMSGAKKLQITEAIHKKTEELSKGMQQKDPVQSPPLLHEPELIIMDEPFSGLDPVNAVLPHGHPRRPSQNKAAPSSSPPTAMDQVEKLCDNICPHSQQPSRTFRAPCVRSSPDTRSTAFLINFTGDDSFPQSPDDPFSKETTVDTPRSVSRKALTRRHFSPRRSSKARRHSLRSHGSRRLKRSSSKKVTETSQASQSAGVHVNA